MLMQLLRLDGMPLDSLTQSTNQQQTVEQLSKGVSHAKTQEVP